MAAQRRLTLHKGTSRRVNGFASSDQSRRDAFVVHDRVAGMSDRKLFGEAKYRP